MNSSRRSVLLETGVDLIVPTVMVFALYLLFAGHNQPGGGFIAGLVAGAGLAVRSMAADPDVEHRPRWPVESLMGLGLLLSTGTATVAWLTGAQLLESGSVVWDLPVLGKVKAFSVLAFDTGVFLVVVGLVVAVLQGLGSSTEDRPAGPAVGDGAPDDSTDGCQR